MTTMESDGADDVDDMDVLEAETVYLFMKKEYRISRSVRAQWFLDHLNTTITVEPHTTVDNCKEELTVISVIPNQPPLHWKVETSHLYKYLITSHTSLMFLGQKYRIVYCLDMSPSLSAVDIQHGEIMIDEMFLSLKASLDGLTRPFMIPGSLVYFQPQIYVTVIAHTPFFTTPAQQVLVQGWQVSPQNLCEFLEAIKGQLERLEDTVAEVAGVVHEQLEALRAESEKLVGGLFEENFEMVPPPAAHIPMVSPDSGFINMLRYGMLALRLLPESSCANLIILTDGIIAVPDVHVFDSVLTQLRTNTVACSFLHVGSLFHPQCCKGMVPYADLMHFIATATFGTYMTTIPEITSVSENQMNMYHRAFLSWNFSKHTTELDIDFGFPQRTGEWHVSNTCFYGIREPLLLRKKQMEDNLSTSLPRILCCRLREGYTIRHISVTDNRIEISMILPWKNHVYIEYAITSQLPSGNQNTGSGVVHYSVCIEAPYEFLHDITCLLKKPFKSPYRQAVVSRFWATLKNLNQSDQLLVHLNSFHTNPASYTVPEGIRSGMPVFYLPLNSSVPVLSSSDMTSSQFAQFWLPVCTLEPAIWQKWLHTERLGLVLLHDHPLPRHLHLPNTSGRFQVVQCRQAAAALNSLLKDWSTFVLIENHTYVKLIPSDADKPPMSFYIIRVTSKPPCVVINMAFLGGTSGLLRYEVIQELKKHIASLKLPPRPSNKESLPRKVSVIKPSSPSCTAGQNGHSPVLRTWSDISCCILLRKPVEKILIRYERMPSDFGTVVFPDGTQPICINKHHIISAYGMAGPNSSAGSGLLTTLSRYLHHRRWIWAAQDSAEASLGIPAVARILSTITKMRLQEGFNFAHSTSGIINMVLEVQMKGGTDIPDVPSETDEEETGIFPCVIQYVLFPPHTTSTSARESCTDDDEDDDATTDDRNARNDQENEGELQIITECWIEPQHGTVVNSPPERYFMEGLPYYMLADVICQVDAECISSLLTFEHLSLMCRNTSVPSPVKVPDTPKVEIVEDNKQDCQSSTYCSQSTKFTSEQRIEFIPFAFNLMKMLPKCQQAEQLFSMYIQDLGSAVPSPVENAAPLLTQTDMPNKLLYDMLYEHFKKLNNKELYLSAEDSQRFLHILLNREREEADIPLPIPKLAGKSVPGQEEGLSCAGSPGSEGTVCDKTPINLKTVPKWRCFLKGISVTHVMLTFVPASFVDLKMLMVTKETLSGAHSSAVKFVSPTHPKVLERPLSLENPESSHDHNNQSEQGKESSIDRINPCVEAVHLALSELIGDRNISMTPTSSASAAHLSRSSSCDTGQVTGQIPLVSRLHSDAGSPLPQRDFIFDTPFRMRASSWDTVKRPVLVDVSEQALDRLRAGSMDSKTRRVRPFLCSSVQLKDSKSDTLLKLKRESDLKKSPPRISPKGSPRKSSSKSSPRKSSIDKVSLLSDLNDGNNADGKSPLKSNLMPNLGAITLPIYVYDCPLALLMEAIVFKDSSVKMKDVYDDRRFKLEDEAKIHYHVDEEMHRSRKREMEERPHVISNIHLSPEPVSDDSESAVHKPNLLHYCKILSLAYSKCFVFTLFKSLHMAHDVHSIDVQAAVDECEETLIDIDITDYLKTVCGHLKDFRIQMKMNEMKHNSAANSPNHGYLVSPAANIGITAPTMVATSSPYDTTTSNITTPTAATTTTAATSTISTSTSISISTATTSTSTAPPVVGTSDTCPGSLSNISISKIIDQVSSLPVADGIKQENADSVCVPSQQPTASSSEFDIFQDASCNLQVSDLSSQSVDNVQKLLKKEVGIVLVESQSCDPISSQEQKTVHKVSVPVTSPESVPLLENESPSQKSTSGNSIQMVGESEKVKESYGGITADEMEMKFPVSLLQLHFPCRDLKQLHRMIKDKFMSILMTSFKPVPSYPEFYFCAPYWDKIQQDEAVADLSKPQVIETEDEVDKLTYSGIVEFRSDHESILGQEAPDETRTSLLSNVDSDSLSELQDDISEEVSPLFLHLTCTLRCKDKIGSCSVRMLPTCLGELIQALELNEAELSLNHLQVTLDVLCLTLPPDVESVTAEKGRLEMRNTSLCSTSPPPAEDEANLATSASGSLISMQQYVDEAVPADRLKHLPDYQHKAVTTCVEEIQWLMRDEIAAFLLDIFPLQEQTLSLVADHVASSPGRASCLMEKVPLQFVFGPEQSLERFLQEFCKLNVNGYHLKQVGCLYYLVKDKQMTGRKKTSSLIPPLGMKNLYQPHMEDSTELWNDVTRLHIPISSDENGVLQSYTYTTLETCPSEDDPKQNFVSSSPKRSKLQGVAEVSIPPEDSDSDDESCDPLQWRRGKKNVLLKRSTEQWRGTWHESLGPSLSVSLTASPSLSLVAPDAHVRMQSSHDDRPVSALKRSQSCGINTGKREEVIALEPELSPARWSSVLAWQRRQQGTPGYRSEVSSLVESAHGTEDGYEGDSSDSAEENDWLEDLETCRPSLPNFWLIMRVDKDAVTTYFHCRCLEIEAKEVHRSVIACIKSLCKVVNQTMLLQNLHDTRMCDQLLEPESSEDIWKNNPDAPPRDNTFTRMKSFDDSTDNEYQGSYLEATMKFRPGWFACNVVWETHFCLHPRLKTGPGKSLFSRGIQALRSVLNRFSVNNRKNMFVYQDISGNVFYLRLHENFRWLTKLTPTGTSGSLGPGRSDTEENSPGAVSRSSSVTSLTASARKTSTITNDETLLQAQAETRPRIRSFGEKDNITVSPAEPATSLTPQPPVNRPEGSVVLKVHGISEAGPQVKEELVQVLQNRLDDAVLEVLSIMLARNPMCKLTPDDVHFIQKPHHTPESVIQFSIQPHALSHLQALAYYLRQNLLEFMYIPKYTDARPEFHFQDYSQPESSKKRVTESDLFLYNQTPACGNRGIACIALAVVDSPGNLVQYSHYPKPFTCAYKESMCKEDFASLTSASTYIPDENTIEPDPAALVEFRIWKQGRVNMEYLTQKLCAAVRHSTWDLLTEFCLLTAPLTQNASSMDSSPSHLKVGESTEVAEDASLSTASEMQDESQACEADAAEVFESEENYFLHEVYQNTMQPWLKFAVELSVPAVKKHTVDLCARHSLAVMVKEVQNLVKINATDTSAVVFYPTLNPETNKLMFTLSHDTKFENTFSHSEERSYCLVIGRNVDQWRACVTDDGTFDQDVLFPKAQKVFQKFPPLLVTHISGSGSTQFVPRQRFLLAVLTNQQITMYTYNWSKERVENLNIQAKDLGHWLSARSSLLTSILMQKMGLFHKMEIVRKQETTSQVANPYTSRVVDLEDLIKFSPSSTILKDTAPRRQGLGTNYGGLVPGLLSSALHDVFRDSKPSRPMHRMSYHPDPVVRNAYQLQDTRQRDKRDDQKKLYVMWHTRVATPNIPLAEDVVHLFKQHSRVIHYCLTPLLFLPRWRIQSAATRDHLLSLSSNMETSHLADSKVKTSRSSAGSTKTSDALGIMSQQTAVSPPQILRRDSEDKWHHALCINFIQEYKQYLQTLGFIPIQTEAPASKKSVRPGGTKAKEVHYKEYPESNVCYLQKSILGGILLFEISMCEPFFVAKLHALECSRLQSKTSSALVSQFTLSFLDECDKIKILMHLHSFAYDYHLRSISSYVSGHHAILKQGYHLTHFLDDFLKYYSKAPNFARNLVYADMLSVSNVTTPPQQLFNYLLSHEKVYKMEVFRMAPVTHETDSSVDNEYVLVQLENMPHVTYRDAHDMSHTDEFSVTLIVSHDSVPHEKQDITDQSTLHLKYYIILTSTSELFPKLEIGSKLGKFRTVSTASHDPMQLYSPRGIHATSEVHVSDIGDRDTKPPEAVSVPPCAPVTVLAPLTPQAPALPAPLTDCDLSDKQELSLPVLPHHTEIRQESVNYLGYYSSHEQLMHELILERASTAQKCIQDMVAQGMEHCRTHLLWNKLLNPSRESDRRKDDSFSRDLSSSGLSYNEFCELRNLAVVEPISQLDPRLAPLLCQTLPWYQALAKVLKEKYSDHYRHFVAPDGNVQHVVVLHPRYLEAFMMLSIDTNTSRGDLCAVYSKPLQEKKQTSDQMEFCVADIQSLVEGFVNACCFHLWVSLL
ncbi:hypothetical protein R5R35_004159 [Gryllus longicercus]|uniref:Protein SZT2 n=2 Tax=Gryllus longicercus TaxID=2509291 RepID=A0AAN9VGV0_9ORTH